MRSEVRVLPGPPSVAVRGADKTVRGTVLSDGSRAAMRRGCRGESKHLAVSVCRADVRTAARPSRHSRSGVTLKTVPRTVFAGPSGRPRDGAIAQLGERVLCKHEVAGSSPAGSTIGFMRRGWCWDRILGDCVFRRAGVGARGVGTRQSLVFADVRPCGSVRWVPVVVGHGEEVCEAGFGPAAAYRSVRGVGCPWGPDPACVIRLECWVVGLCALRAALWTGC